VHQLRSASPIGGLSNQSSAIIAPPIHLKIQWFDYQPQKLCRFIHSSVNSPAFTQATNASFSFPILRATAVDVSFPKQLNCKTRSFILQSDVCLVEDSPFFDRFSLSNVIQSSFL
jgi:hypothetical protein